MCNVMDFVTYYHFCVWIGDGLQFVSNLPGYV